RELVSSARGNDAADDFAVSAGNAAACEHDVRREHLVGDYTVRDDRRTVRECRESRKTVVADERRAVHFVARRITRIEREVAERTVALPDRTYRERHLTAHPIHVLEQ